MRARGMLLLAITVVALHPLWARGTASNGVRLKLVMQSPNVHHPVPAVVWLSPAPGTSVPPFVPQGPYVLLQKNRTFRPHVQVVPVGAVVQFPNADPYFHNVFSLFEGKRFDLGLYEAGSTKAVTFSREGVSYIFCNIHPEMSAVIVTLSTPLYATGNTGQEFTIPGVNPGDYYLKLWVEGVPADTLEKLQRRVHVRAGGADLGEVVVTGEVSGSAHKNKFGQPYPFDPHTTY